MKAILMICAVVLCFVIVGLQSFVWFQSYRSLKQELKEAILLIENFPNFETWQRLTSHLTIDGFILSQYPDRVTRHYHNGTYRAGAKFNCAYETITLWE